MKQLSELKDEKGDLKAVIDYLKSNDIKDALVKWHNEYLKSDDVVIESLEK